MFENEPLWAVDAVLKQHCSHLDGGKTNKAYKLKLKTHRYCTLPCYFWLPSVASRTKPTVPFSIRGVFYPKKN